MEKIKVKSWEDFEAKLDGFLHRLGNRQNEPGSYVSPPLFRGHRDARWKLETTLERSALYPVPTEEYFHRIQSVRPAVVSLTGKEWDLPDDMDPDQVWPHAPPGYAFMIYLRHHGFPSPLLDWSRSPYVAAFFAFHSAQGGEEGDAAVYSYVEYMGGPKIYDSGEAKMSHLGPYVVSHRRHYSQQCEYTICTKGTKNTFKDRHYANHEELAIRTDRAEEQDCFRKYIIPRWERRKALDRLELMNITAFSLFGSEESLMETLAYREIEKRMVPYTPPDYL